MSKQKETTPILIHETFRIAAVLAVVGGFLDAYTYILRGGVFANAQTGNIVLLGIHLAEGEIHEALYYSIPIIAFVAGVFITELFRKMATKRQFDIFEHWVIAIEIVCLFVIGWIPDTAPNGIVNVIVSFVCSLQANSFRRMKNLAYATTMCTGNLRSGTEKLFHYLMDGKQKEGREAAHYFGIIGLFIVGAIVGALFSTALGVKSVWIACVLLLGVFVVMIVKRQ